MKKIIALFLSLSLLLCTNALVYAAEGDDDSNEPIAAVGDVSETVAESSSEEEAGLTEEPTETETTESTEKSDEMETNVPIGESEPPDTSEPTESPAPEDTASAENSETSQKPTETVPTNDAQPTSDEKPSDDHVVVGDSPMVVEESTYKVTVSWTGLVFTYHPETKTKWSTDPSSLGYQETVPAHWTSSDSEKAYGTFTVAPDAENPSEIQVDFAFTASRALGDLNGKVAMKFSSVSGEAAKDLKTPNNKASLEVPKSNTSYMYVAPAVSNSMTSEQIKTAFSDGVKLGTITITLKSAWTDPESPDQPGMD